MVQMAQPGSWEGWDRLSVGLAVFRLVEEAAVPAASAVQKMGRMAGLVLGEERSRREEPAAAVAQAQRRASS
jgi:hypothetical protein